jgi:hypothetical protein
MRNGLCTGCALPFHFILGEHYCEDSKKNKFTTNVSSFATFLIVLFHDLNKLTHLVAHAYLLTGASKGRPIFFIVVSGVQVIQ